MKQIQVTYRRCKALPFLKTIRSRVAESWTEINADQLVALAAVKDPAEKGDQLLSILVGIPQVVLDQLSDYQRYKIAELPGTWMEQKAHHSFIIPRLVLPRTGFWGRRLVLNPPQPKLKAVSFGQFIFADSYFAAYQESGNLTDLNKFVASLYLAKNESFKECLIQQRFEQIGKLDLNIRLAIALNYQLVREWLSLAYPLIFQKQQDPTLDDPSSNESLSDSTGQGLTRKPSTNPWIKIFQNFVGDDILHDDQWAAKPVNTILAYMTRKYKENARRK